MEDFPKELTLSAFCGAAIRQNTTAKILACNEQTAPYGLTLTPEAAAALAETQALSLKRAGRIEFGGGVMENLILAFCDSPYLDMQTYEQTLHVLAEGFYEFKNETCDVLSDAALVRLMRQAFDGVCRGSTEHLLGTVLPELARHIRRGGTLREFLAVYDVDGVKSEDSMAEEGADCDE